MKYQSIFFPEELNSQLALAGQHQTTQVSAGETHTALLRSDGSAVACGCSIVGCHEGHCDIPPLSLGERYIHHVSLDSNRVLQLEFLCEDDALTLICSNLAGEEELHMTVHGSDLAWETHKRIAREMKLDLQTLRLTLPDGQLLHHYCRANPVATVADISEHSNVGTKLLPNG